MQQVLDFLTLDHLVRGFLFTTKEPFVICLVLLGFFFHKKYPYGLALVIVTFSMIVNVFLKNYFQVPLNDWLKQDGFAFPSGHMQFACAFWLSLLWHFRNKYFAILTATIIAGEAYGLTYFNYHNLKDIIAAFLTAIIIVATIHLFSSKFPHFKRNPFPLALILSIISAILIIFIPNRSHPHLSHIWLALGILFGFSLGWQLLIKLSLPNSLPSNILAFTLAILGTLCLKYLYQTTLSSPTPFLITSFYATLALWISLASPYLAHQCLKLSPKHHPSA